LWSTTPWEVRANMTKLDLDLLIIWNKAKSVGQGFQNMKRKSGIR